MTGSRNSELHSSLLLTGQESESVPGGWRSACFILGGGILERFAYYGVEANLITFLTGPLKEYVATAAAQVNTWIGVVSLVPILGAFLADSFTGRYRSIIVFALVYILGIDLLTLSATVISTTASNSQEPAKSGCQTQVRILFFASLYVVALAQGYKACVQAFGADQFDENQDVKKRDRAKSSFFNWWVCGLALGGLLSHLILRYIQENISWRMGFGIPCLAMVVGLIQFLIGNPTYRFPARVEDDQSSSERIISQLASQRYFAQWGS